MLLDGGDEPRPESLLKRLPALHDYVAASLVAQHLLAAPEAALEQADDEIVRDIRAGLALTALERALVDNGTRAKLINKRIAQIRRLRSKGASYTEIVSNEDGPLIVQLLTESSTALDRFGANVRRAEAHALYTEGLTMEQIAEHFGVTRQRVSTLLRKAFEPA